MTKVTRLTNQRLRLGKSNSTHSFVDWLQSHVVLVNTTLTIAVVLVGCGYLAVVNNTASDSFTVHQLSQRIDDVKQKNSDLELSVSEVLSLQHISANNTANNNMVVASDVEYLPSTHNVAFSQ